MTRQLSSLLLKALAFRQDLLDDSHQGALRLFNGFTEGYPSVVMDLYARTVVIHDYSSDPQHEPSRFSSIMELLLKHLPWLQACVLKSRNSQSEGEKNGRLLFGSSTDHKVQEHRVWYALDLCMHQDSSLYLDTRNLRRWAIDNLREKSVLNTFAYTGSLGVAALAGGARRVVQTDLDRTFLNLAKTSCTLNGFPVHKADFITGDFWSVVGRLKRVGERFDCIFLDPPFFSTTSRGGLDLNRDSARLINKVRPLINNAGRLVAINNALYVSGAEYMAALDDLSRDGYLKVAELVPVPEDITGFSSTQDKAWVTDPAPFNHPTKIAVLEVKRK